MDDDLDLDTLLGIPAGAFEAKAKRGKTKPAVLVECGQTPPKEKAERWNNFHTFTFGGYLARVVRTTCSTCESLQDTLEGIFLEEVHSGPDGQRTRRLTALAKGGDWPAEGGHRKEVTEREVDLCGGCVGDLGFSREVRADGQPFTLVAGKGRL